MPLDVIADFAPNGLKISMKIQVSRTAMVTVKLGPGRGSRNYRADKLSADWASAALS